MTVVDTGWAPWFKRFLVNTKIEVTVGIHEGDNSRDDGTVSNADIGYIHEFLLHGGSRSFMRSTFDEKENAWEDTIEKFYAAAARGTLDIKAVPALIGMNAVSDVKQKIRSDLPPPLAPQTIARKGSSNTLIDTGQMINAVDWEEHG